ncbi:MAG: PIN domain-containing protein, partial [Rhodocyclaceae bacterium]|nr:PIN domain-containing protein [Rhodocyclaceae bacterium]
MNAPVTALRLVLDTNVVLALWHFRDPALRALATLLAQPSTRLFTREDALAELADVLARARFALAPDEQTALLARYRARCEILPARAPNAPPLPR